MYSTDNPLGTKYLFTEQTNGLTNSWNFVRSVYINPPYNREISKWLSKVHTSRRSNKDQTVVMLLPARTDTRWFHQYIYMQPDVEIRFLQGRLKFDGCNIPIIWLII